MTKRQTIGVRPEHIRFAVGYGSISAWGIMMLYVPWAASLGFSLQALLSMVPGLVVCLACLLLFRQRLSLSGRTPLVAAAALCASSGTLACTYPALAAVPGVFVAGMALSGGFAILLIMAWFDAFTRIGPRGIIVLSGCSIAVTALESWAIVLCDEALASVLTSLLPMLSFVLLPLVSAKTGRGGRTGKATSAETPATEGLRAVATPPRTCDEDTGSAAAENAPGHLLARTPGLADVLSAAVPLRTLAGFAITFFVLSSITTIVVGRDELARLGALTLLIPLAAALFFVASGFFARGKIDPSILYKVLLCATAAFVFFSIYLGRGNGVLTLHAHNVIEAMAWVVLALGAKKTPVAPHLVFAVGWIAECVGKTLGQLVAPLLAGDPLVLMAIVAMLVLLGVGFAFSEGYHLLDIDDEEGEPAAAAAPAAAAPCHPERSIEGAESKDLPAAAVPAAEVLESPSALLEESSGAVPEAERPDPLRRLLRRVRPLAPRERGLPPVGDGPRPEVHPERAVRLGVHGEIAPAQHLSQMRHPQPRRDHSPLRTRGPWLTPLYWPAIKTCDASGDENTALGAQNSTYIASRRAETVFRALYKSQNAQAALSERYISRILRRMSPLGVTASFWTPTLS